MCRVFLKDEVNWRIVQILLALAGIVAASLFAYQQTEINKQLLDLNFRTLIDFQYNENSGVARLYNYGETPIRVEAARAITLPESKSSISIQKVIFPKQSIELKFKEHLTHLLPSSEDGHYGGMYQLFLQIDTITGKRKYIGQIAFSLEIKEEKINYIIPSDILSIYKYEGTAFDFINRNAN